MITGGPWDNAPNHSDGYPWWGINPPWTLPPQNGFACGLCGQWVFPGVYHFCQYSPPSPYTAPLGYTCTACGSWVQFGLYHDCKNYGEYGTTFKVEMPAEETPQEEMLRLLRRLVELQEAQIAVDELLVQDVEEHDETPPPHGMPPFDWGANLAGDTNESTQWTWTSNNAGPVITAGEVLGFSFDYEGRRYLFVSEFAATRAKASLPLLPSLGMSEGLLMEWEL